MRAASVVVGYEPGDTVAVVPLVPGEPHAGVTLRIGALSLNFDTAGQLDRFLTAASLALYEATAPDDTPEQINRKRFDAFFADYEAGTGEATAPEDADA